MSYKALLFCLDEAAARLVTQVLSELDFTVELSFEPFVTVKKLSDESFDALVVDCADEQNASLLFKGARNSSLNHSSLCVAVAEGQTGVANAFRIGANLVLTKPINIEQSKNTLRVAKGLLRKSPPVARPATAEPPPPTQAEKTGARSTATTSVATSTSAAHEPGGLLLTRSSSEVAAPRSVPSSLFEAEQVKPPASDMPQPAPAPVLATPGSVSPSPMARAAAAPALAPERPSHAAELAPAPVLKSAPPLATQDPIFPTTAVAEPRKVPMPTLSPYASRPSASKNGGSKAFWVIACLLLLGAAGYFGGKKLPLRRYIGHIRIPAIKLALRSAHTPAESPAQDQNSSPDGAAAQAQQEVAVSSETGSVPSTGNAFNPTSSAANSTGAIGFPTKEHIDVSIPAEAPDQPGSAEKPEPVVVLKPALSDADENRAKTSTAPQQPGLAPQPPQLVLSASNPSDSALAGIVSSNPSLPKAAQSTLRISQGITQGLLIKRVSPVYPPMALEMRKQGTVDLLATISKSGAITKVAVLSGDATLAKSAVEAVRQWKYRPYLLNGEPVEIETQITMNFTLPH
jgi:TonB family protein